MACKPTKWPEEKSKAVWNCMSYPLIAESTYFLSMVPCFLTTISAQDMPRAEKSYPPPCPHGSVDQNRGNTGGNTHGPHQFLPFVKNREIRTDKWLPQHFGFIIDINIPDCTGDWDLLYLLNTGQDIQKRCTPSETRWLMRLGTTPIYYGMPGPPSWCFVCNFRQTLSVLIHTG